MSKDSLPAGTEGSGWTAERLARYQASMAARKAAGLPTGGGSRKKIKPVKSTKIARVVKTDKTPSHNFMDAVTFLRHARTDLHIRLAAGKLKQFDNAHLLMLLALEMLETFDAKES